MSQQGYSIGRDVTLTVILPDGTTLPLSKVTGFTAKPDTTTQKIKPLNGKIDNLRFIEGWSGSFSMERRGATIDQYFAQLEDNYYGGLDEPPAILQQTIQEPDGSISQFRFERLILNYDDAGDWAADKSVSQKISFMAGRRVRQA
jgi:hypothetical protein